MNHLFNLFLVCLVLLNATGAGLLASRWLKLPYGLAQAAGILVLCSGLFFIEHLEGLGSLGWVLPLSTLGSGWLVYTDRAQLRAARPANIWLLIGFLYVFAWRYALPNIDSNTERLPDLSFIVNYMQGLTLPPPDVWYPPHVLNHYYSFQHYGAALLGRIFMIEPGVAYNVSYALLAGFATSAAYEVVSQLCRQRWAQSLVLAVFLVGGTGASVITPFMSKPEGKVWWTEHTYDSMRFVGGTTFYADDRLSTFGRWIKDLGTPAGAQREQVYEMPMETFSYVVELGDYHAPLGGFWILAISLAALILVRRNPADAPAAALLGATIPLSVAINTWSLPFQGVMSVGLIAFLWLERRESIARSRPALAPVNWQAFLVGAAGTAFLMYPFFSYFLVLNIGNKSPLQMIPAGSSTPVLYFLIVFWPILIVSLLHFFAARGTARFHAFFWLLALAASEVFFINDIYAGSAERFNTTLKWWPWVFNGALLTLAASNLNSSYKLVRTGTVIVLALLLTYTASLSHYYFGTIYNLAKMGIWHGGQLNGSAWLRQDPPVRTALEYLKVNPRGVFVESPDNMAFCQVGAFSLFSGQPTLLGWASHEQLWRGYLTDTYDRYLNIKKLYTGDMVDPLKFLKAHDVRYILWLPRDNANKEALVKLSAQLAPEFHWNEFYRANENYAVGIWSRR